MADEELETSDVNEHDEDEDESSRTYIVSGGTETHEVEGRDEAVQLAKRLSGEDGLRVTVERADGMETMQFINGGLETFVCETRDRKGRSRS